MSQKNINPLVPELRRTILNLATANFKARESFLLNEILLGNKPDVLILSSMKDSMTLVQNAAIEIFRYKEEPEIEAIPEEAMIKTYEAAEARAKDYMRRNKIAAPESFQELAEQGKTGYPDVSETTLETTLQTSVLLYKTLQQYRTVVRAEGLASTRGDETALTELAMPDIQDIAFNDALISLVYHGKTDARAEDACELLELMGMKLIP